ncbi:MAG: extracellular solute-binding protein [Candidatus Hydrogenedentota bacterium]
MKPASLIFIYLFILIQPLSSITITLWHSALGKEAEVIEGLATIFNLQSNDINLRVENVRKEGQGWFISDYVVKKVKEGRGPDVFIWVNDKIGYWANHNIIYPLDEFLDKDKIYEFLPSTVEAVKFNERYYGLPVAFECLILFYNKKYIKNPPLTTDDLIKLAKEFTDKKHQLFGLCYQNRDFYHHAIWFNGFGAKLFDERGKPIVTSKECRDSLIFAKRIITNEKIFLLSSDIGGDEVSYDLQFKYFNEEKIAMMITGPWALCSINSNIDFGIAKLPFIKEANNWAEPYLGVKAIMITTSSKHKKEAFSVASFYASSYAGYVFATQAGYQPAAKGAYAYDEVNKNQFSIMFRNQAYNSKPLPNREEMEIVWNVMNGYWQTAGDPSTERKGIITLITIENGSTEKVLKDYQKIVDEEFKKMRKK